MGLVTDFAISERKDSPVGLFEAAIKKCWSRCWHPVAREISKELI
jgi:hypothetical protein